MLVLHAPSIETSTATPVLSQNFMMSNFNRQSAFALVHEFQLDYGQVAIQYCNDFCLSEFDDLVYPCE